MKRGGEYRNTNWLQWSLRVLKKIYRISPNNRQCSSSRPGPISDMKIPVPAVSFNLKCALSYCCV